MYRIKFPEGNPLKSVKHLGGNRQRSLNEPLTPISRDFNCTGSRIIEEFETVKVLMGGSVTYQGSQAIALWEMQQKARYVHDMKSLGVPEDEIKQILSVT